MDDNRRFLGTLNSTSPLWMSFWATTPPPSMNEGEKSTDSRNEAMPFVLNQCLNSLKSFSVGPPTSRAVGNGLILVLCWAKTSTFPLALPLLKILDKTEELHKMWPLLLLFFCLCNLLCSCDEGEDKLWFTDKIWQILSSVQHTLWDLSHSLFNRQVCFCVHAVFRLDFFYAVTKDRQPDKYCVGSWRSLKWFSGNTSLNSTRRTRSPGFAPKQHGGYRGLGGGDRRRRG